MSEIICSPKIHSPEYDSFRSLIRSLIRYYTEYEDPDKSESGMVYFDLPDLDDEEEESAKTTTTVKAPPFVAEFWKFVFSILMLDWLRQHNKETKRIKND